MSEFGTAPPFACKTTPKNQSVNTSRTVGTILSRCSQPACTAETWAEGPRIVLDSSNKLQGVDSPQCRMTDLGFHYRPASDPENRCVEL